MLELVSLLKLVAVDLTPSRHYGAEPMDDEGLFCYSCNR